MTVHCVCVCTDSSRHSYYTQEGFPLRYRNEVTPSCKSAVPMLCPVFGSHAYTAMQAMADTAMQAMADVGIGMHASVCDLVHTTNNTVAT